MYASLPNPSTLWYNNTIYSKVHTLLQLEDAWREHYPENKEIFSTQLNSFGVIFHQNEFLEPGVGMGGANAGGNNDGVKQACNDHCLKPTRKQTRLGGDEHNDGNRKVASIIYFDEKTFEIIHIDHQMQITNTEKVAEIPTNILSSC